MVSALAGCSQLSERLAHDLPRHVGADAADRHRLGGAEAPRGQMGGPFVRRHSEAERQLLLPAFRYAEGLHPDLDVATVSTSSLDGAFREGADVRLRLRSSQVPVRIRAEAI